MGALKINMERRQAMAVTVRLAKSPAFRLITLVDTGAVAVTENAGRGRRRL